MKSNQSLEELISKLIIKISKIIKKEKFDYVVVHGDTTSTIVGSMVSFYNKVPVCPVEEGLRTDNIYNPFPEEINRRITGVISYRLCANIKSKIKLIKRKKRWKKHYITGNTVIDALLRVINNKKDNIEKTLEKYNLKYKKYILLTMHRR